MLFCILLSSVTADLGLFSQALPSILLRDVSYIVLTFVFRRQLFQLLKEETDIKFYSIFSVLLLIWGLFASKSINEYAVCIENLHIPLLPIWIILLRLPNHTKILKFIFWCMMILSISKYVTESQSMNNFGGYTSLLYVYVLFLPYLNKIKKLIVLIFWILSLTYDMTDRTHLLVMTCSIILSFAVYTNLYTKILIRNSNFCKLMILVPFIMVILVFTSYNIFKLSESEQLAHIQGAGTEHVDTRSELYKEVISDQGGIVSWIIGKSYIGSYDSSLADYYGGIIFHRMGCEVGILEVFIRGGLSYVIIIALLFRRISKLGLMNSSNKFCKSIAYFILLYRV